jgi:hypothetical protein
MNGCLFCGGSGKLALPTWTAVCVYCDGTGSLLAMWLLRAYNLGVADGMRAVREGMPQFSDGPMGIDRLLTIVWDVPESRET